MRSYPASWGLSVTCFLLASWVFAQDPLVPKEIGVLKGHNATVWCVAFSHDGKSLASGGADKKIRIWDRATQNNSITLDGHTEDWITAVAFSPDDSTLVSHGQEPAVRIWDLKNKKNISTLEGRGNANCLAFQDNNEHVVYSTGDVIEQWNWKRNRLVTLYKVAEIQNDLHFAFASKGSLWTIGRNTRTSNPVIHTRPAKGEFVTLSKNHGPFSAPFSPGANLVVTGIGSTDICLWECSTGKSVWTINVPNRGAVLTFSPDGKMIAVSVRVRLPGPEEAGGIIFLDAATGKELAAVQAHRAKAANISGMAFSPDGKTLASASVDHTIKLFDVSMLWPKVEK